MTSILAQITPPAPAPPDESPLVVPVLAALTLALAAAWRAGVFRPNRIIGPSRLRPDESASSLIVCLLVALATMALTAATAHYLLPDHQPNRELIAGLIGTACSFFAVVVFNGAVRANGLQQLGLNPARLPRAIPAGVLALLIVLPCMFLTAHLSQLIWQWLAPGSELRHPLFQQWNAMDRTARIAAVIHAVVIAPLWEEAMFRGLLQTALARGLQRLHQRLFSRRWERYEITPPIPVAAATSDPPDATYVIPLDYMPPTPAPSPRATWWAIMITSVTFASVHPPFSWLPIFVLSVGLGCLYERTGNLWACIVMHALFNSLSFSLFSLMPN